MLTDVEEATAGCVSREGITRSRGKDGWQGDAAVAKVCAVPAALGN